jgi:hypothetical protein
MPTVTTSRGLSGEANGADGRHDPRGTRAGHETLRLWGSLSGCWFASQGAMLERSYMSAPGK